MNSRVLPKTEIEARLEQVVYYGSEMSIAEAMLRVTHLLAVPGYTCLRPPGAAGAIFEPHNSVRGILGCAEPPDKTIPTCKELGKCEMENGHCVRTIHAEEMAILLAARYNMPTNNGTIYSLLKPCYQCTKRLIAAGIKEIYYAGKAYDEQRTRDILELAGVKCIYVDIGLEYGNG